MTNSRQRLNRSGRFYLLKGFLVAAVVLFTESVMNGVTVADMLAAPCSLDWSSSPSNNAVGYAVYYGIEGSSSTNRVDVGASLTVTFYSLLANTNYFFYAVAYDADGHESIPSQMVRYRPSFVSTPALKFLSDGTLNISFHATPGAFCQIEYATSLAAPQWQILGYAVADGTGSVSIVDPLQGHPPGRFYRAARLP